MHILDLIKKKKEKLITRIIIIKKKNCNQGIECDYLFSMDQDVSYGIVHFDCNP